MQKKILITEDNTNLARIYQHLFRSFGFSVALAKNGLDVLSILSKYKPDVVLLDLHLPQLSGFDILHTMKQEACYAKIKVVLHSGDFMSLEKAREQADACVPKPSHISHIVKTVNHVLSK